MYKMLFITDNFEPFTSISGTICKPQKHEKGFVVPLGWERELRKRNIEFEVIEIEVDSNDLELI